MVLNTIPILECPGGIAYKPPGVSKCFKNGFVLQNQDNAYTVPTLCAWTLNFMIGKQLNVLLALCLNPPWGLFKKPCLEVIKLFPVKFDSYYVGHLMFEQY